MAARTSRSTSATASSALRPSFLSPIRVDAHLASRRLSVPLRQHRLSSSSSSPNLSASLTSSSSDSLFWSESSSDAGDVHTPATDTQPDIAAELAAHDAAEVDVTRSKNDGVSTTLLTQDLATLQDAVGDGESGKHLIQKYCCGGGCCFLNAQPPVPTSAVFTPLDPPQNPAFKSLNLNLSTLSADTELTNIVEYPVDVPSFTSVPSSAEQSAAVSSRIHPPAFVQPHPPYSVFSAPLYHARELTKPGAEKRTFHFDIDVTDYPEESGVDFKVGGAVGVVPANDTAVVDELFDVLGVPKFLRDKPVLLQTKGGRWPTVWGDEQSRSLVTTRRDILSWCTDVQSYPPTKALLRVLAEHATDSTERKILFFLASAQGQQAFCDLRTGSHLSLLQLLHAFPSTKPPLSDLLACLSQLMPRFYSLSNDPYVSSEREGLAGRRLIEIAVSVHTKSHWDPNARATGVGSGFLERLALKFMEAEKKGESIDLRVPLFRGLMSNPLSKQFSAKEGPMMLIGAGVGMAPFRGFILNRLKNASCASKIWLVQGVRDSQVDELYSGELGQYEAQIKKVVQSRVSKKKKSIHGAHLVNGALHHSASESDISQLQKDFRAMGEIVSDPVTQETNDRTAQSNGHGGTRWSATEDSDQESKYVQDEVRQQADIVIDVITAIDGRIFVCGSSKGMGEGVEQALRDVVMKKKNMTEEAARTFWEEMAASGKYIAETW